MHYKLAPLVDDTDSNAWCTDAEQLIRCHAKLLLYANVIEDTEGIQPMQVQIQPLLDRLAYKLRRGGRRAEFAGRPGSAAGMARDLPAKPERLMTSPAPPALDRTCQFPWFGVAGCRGKDPSVMLRLTVSHDQGQVRRLDGFGAWYKGVRAD